jgi:adhesin transport system membrane fusion protein
MSDDQFLDDDSVKTLRNPKKSTHLILWIILAFIVLGLIWANYALVDEVTRGEGKVIPSSQVQVIQNLEGGIVEKIFVKEGEVVQKGQKLVKLDGTRFQSAYDEDNLKAMALEIKIERLTAEAQNIDFKPKAEFAKKLPDAVRNEMALFNSHKAQLSELQNNITLAQKELNLSKPLINKGAVSDVEILRLNRDVSQLQAQLDEFKGKNLNELSDTLSLYNHFIILPTNLLWRTSTA